jgi:hypothetical protein
MIRPLAMVVLALTVAAAPARGEIQKSGPQVWPGKLQVGVHPFGGQFGFTGNEASGYKLTADIAGLLKEFDKVSLWLGGGFNYAAGFFTCAGCGHDLQLWVFVELSLEKLLNIPLVPFFRAGPGGDVLIYGVTAGAFIFRIGSGLHYFLTKNVGLGVEGSFSLGAGFYRGVIGTAFYGEWDGTMGARFAF